MATTTEEHKLKLTADNSDQKRKLADSERAVQRYNNSLKNLAAGGAFAVAGLTAALAGAASVTRKSLDIADLGDQYKDLEDAFESFNRAAGRQVGYLEQLQKATDNAVSNQELFKAANKASTLELEKSGISVVDLADKVKDFADGTGRDFVSAFDAISSALATGRVQSLQTIGLTLDLDSAYAKQAETLGKTVKELTTAEKALAKQQGAVDSLSAAVAKLTGAQENAGDAAQIVKASWENLVDQFRAGFAESDKLRVSFRNLATELDSIDWRRVGQDIADLTSKVVQAITAVTDFATQVENLVAAHRPWERSVISTNKHLLDQAKTVNEVLAVMAQYNLESQRIRKRQEEVADAQAKTRNPLNMLGVEYDALSGALSGYNELMQESVKKLTELSNESGRTENRLERLGETAGGKAADGFKKLKEQLEGLRRDLALEGLDRQFDTAIGAGDSLGITALGEKFRDQVRAGVIAGLEDGVDPNDPKVAGVADEIAELYAGRKVLDAQERAAEKQKELFQKNADFLTDALYNAYTGAAFNAKDVMLRVLAGVAGGAGTALAQSFGVNVGQFANLQQFGQQIGSQIVGGATGSAVSSVFGFGGGASSGVDVDLGGVLPASIFGGPSFNAAQNFGIGAGLNTFAPLFAAPLAYQVATNSISGIGNVFEGGRLSFAEQTALALPTFGASYLYNPVRSLFQGGKDPDQLQRDSIRDAISQILGGSTTLFNAGGAVDVGRSSFNIEGGSLAEQLVPVAAGLGQLFGQTETGRDQLTAMFANAAAEAGSFAEGVQNLVGYVDQLGLSADAGKGSLLAMFEEGIIGLSDLTAGVGAFNTSVDDTVESAQNRFTVFAQFVGEGKPRESLAILERAFESLRNAGVSNVDEISDRLTDRFGPEAAQVAEDIARQWGISFENLNRDSVDQMVALFNEMQRLAVEIGEAVDIEIGSGFERAESKMLRFTDNAKRALREVEDAARRVGDATANANGAAGGIAPLPITTREGYNDFIARTGQSRTNINRNLGING